MALVLTIDPLLFGVTWLSGPVMENVCKKFAVSNGNVRVRVPTSANIIDPQVIPKGCESTQQMLLQYYDEPEVIVFGYSQGAQIASAWLRKYAGDSPIGPDRLRIILIGNPERGVSHGGGTGKYIDGSPLKDTPNDTAFTVLDVARKDDWYAQPPVPTHIWDQPRCGQIHCSYWAVDLINPDALSTETVGNTTYLVVS